MNKLESTNIKGIEIRDLVVKYRDDKNNFTALENVSFRLNRGEFVSVVGPSGCGKTTLLMVIAGLIRPESGSVLIDGVKTESPGTERGIVFQNSSLFPWMTARQNVALGITQAFKKMKRKETLELAYDWLHKVGLASFENKYPSQLSGGMKQRVAIARAFAMDPEILLMDEPFSALDPRTRFGLQKIVTELWEGDKENRKTVLFITHDINESIVLSDRIIIMNNRPGRVSDIADVPFSRPRDLRKLIGDRTFTDFRSELLTRFGGMDADSDIYGGQLT